MIPKRFTLLDALLIVLLCAGAGFSIPLLLQSRPSSVRVFRDSELIAQYSLLQKTTVHIQGHLGPLTLEIEDGGVQVTEAGCERHVCMRSGKIQRPFEQIVCAPNHLLIEISHSSRDDTLDAVAR